MKHLKKAVAWVAKHEITLVEEFLNSREAVRVARDAFIQGSVVRENYERLRASLDKARERESAATGRLGSALELAVETEERDAKTRTLVRAREKERRAPTVQDVHERVAP